MAGHVTCRTSVPKVYQGVIEDVINGVREAFLDDGVDEQVLAELKQLWESRLTQSRVTAQDGPMDVQSLNSSHQQQMQHQQQQQHPSSIPPSAIGQPGGPTTVQGVGRGVPGAGAIGGAVGGGVGNTGAPTTAPAGATAGAAPTGNMTVPVQITVPAQHGGGVSKTITIHVPSSALATGQAGQQLQNILSAPSAVRTFSLPAEEAARVIQQQVNMALMDRGIAIPPDLQYSNQAQAATTQPNSLVHSQVDGPCDDLVPQSNAAETDNKVLLASESASATGVNATIKRSCLDSLLLSKLTKTQLDGQFGLGDSSDEMTDDDDDDDEDNEEEEDDNEEQEEDAQAQGQEEEPLNSEDDVSDDDNADLFETDDVVVCQYDKINRTRNKWKFNMKDGIMNLKGKDYVFQKSTGDAEW